MNEVLVDQVKLDELKIKDLFFEMKGEDAIQWRYDYSKVIGNQVVCQFSKWNYKRFWQQKVRVRLHKEDKLIPYFGEF